MKKEKDMSLGKRWIKASNSKTANIPENWDTIETHPSKARKDGGVDWRVLVGGGDWTAGWTLIAAEVPDKYDSNGCTRIWFEVDYERFEKGADNDQPSEITDQVLARGKEASSTFISAAKKIMDNFKDSSEHVDWEEAFKRAITNEELAPFVSKSGCDKLKWVAEKEG
jgi:hypothetical protein